MNPSSAGWVSMFFSLYSKEQLCSRYDNDEDFYSQLRNTGFLYGMSTECLLELPESNLVLTEREYAKINLLHAMSYVFFKKHTEANSEDLVNSLLEFYKSIEENKHSFLDFFKIPKKAEAKLESTIDARTHDNVLSNSLTSLLSNIQIFLDVLFFEQFLKDSRKLESYLKSLKQFFFQVCFTALNTKTDKDKYDYRFIELIETSYAYVADDIMINKGIWRLHLSEGSLFEKLYFVDLSLVSVWSDYELEVQEQSFLYDFAQELDLDLALVDQALGAIKGFAIAHEADVKLFEYAHPIKRLYGQSSNTVKTLIIRNKDRLLLELNESGELLHLLSNATYRELTPEEKIKVKNQLLDICKTIPSLTIFLLPGGSLLLPFLIKFIPRLLPSAFVDNQIPIKPEDEA